MRGTITLTKSRRKVLGALIKLTNKLTWSPTLVEIAAETGWTKQYVAQIIKVLLFLGLVEQESYKWRRIKVTKKGRIAWKESAKGLLVWYADRKDPQAN